MKKYFFWVRSVFIESLIFISSFFFLFFKKSNLRWVSKGYKKYQPILLIQGYLHNSSVWLYHGSKFKKRGLGPIYTINFKKPFSSIEEHALELQNKVEAIQKENNTPDLILIGHSMGGLIGSYYALNLAKGSHITDIISIATPFCGSSFANIGIGQCAKEMEKHSILIEELKRQIENDKNIRFYYITSYTDHLVRPQSALIGNNLNNQCMLNGVGHASLLFSKKANDQICKWLLN